MVFTKPSNYDNQQVLPEQSFMRLPKGGYVCKILTVEEQTSKAGNPYLLINMDIAEGEYIGFFADDYNKQSGEKRWHFTPSSDGSHRPHQALCRSTVQDLQCVLGRE